MTEAAAVVVVSSEQEVVVLPTTITTSSSSWEVVLLVDTQELCRAPEWKRDWFRESLRTKIPNVEFRSLPTGDYIWMARNNNNGNSGVEIVLDWVLERKSYDNVAHSLLVKSTTYQPLSQMEVQLFKMRHSGIRHKVMLFEAGNGNSYGCTTPKMKPQVKRIMAHQYMKSFPKQNLDMHVQHTKGLQDTIDYLAKKHQEIQEATLQKDGRLKPRRHSNSNSSSYHHDLTLEEVQQNVRNGFYQPAFQWKLKLWRVLGLGDAYIPSVLKAYPTKRDMMLDLRRNRHDTWQRLASLQPTTTTSSLGKRPRAMGKVVAQRILDIIQSGAWDSDDDDDDIPENANEGAASKSAVAVAGSSSILERNRDERDRTKKSSRGSSCSDDYSSSSSDSSDTEALLNYQPFAKAAQAATSSTSILDFSDSETEALLTFQPFAAKTTRKRKRKPSSLLPSNNNNSKPAAKPRMAVVTPVSSKNTDSSSPADHSRSRSRVVYRDSLIVVYSPKSVTPDHRPSMRAAAARHREGGSKKPAARVLFPLSPRTKESAETTGCNEVIVLSSDDECC